MAKILILTNSAGGFYLFRRELVGRLLEKNHKIFISAPDSPSADHFTGCTFIKTVLHRRKVNPLADMRLLTQYIRIINKVKPSIVLTYTIKPNVYGGMACLLLRTPYIANITGLGSAIETRGAIQKIAISLYKAGLLKAKCVFFQNTANREFFHANNIGLNNSRLIPGSGVNLGHFGLEEYPPEDQPLKFLFIGRIMKDKGINELVEAATIIKSKYPNVGFDIVGESEENYTDLLSRLQEQDVITYYDHQENIRPFIKRSHATILPSYHEGTSNVLLESASSGRPVIASRIPGCAETFDEGISGIGFEVRNAEGLTDAIAKFIELPYQMKKAMGLAGRQKMEAEYDRNLVINAYMEEINRTIGHSL